MKKRIFVAVPFDGEARRGIEKVLNNLKRRRWPVKWEKIDKLHITMAFLGWVEERQVERVGQVAQVVQGVAPFEVGFKGLGAFPDLAWPRVIWVGLKGDLKNLAKLYKDVGHKLEEIGFELEDKPFVPHVTLGRIAKDTKMKYRQDIGRQVAKMIELDIPHKLRVDRLVVYESKMTRFGSEYIKINQIKLNGRV